MYIEVRKAKAWPTHLVKIDKEIYEMNEQANQPNGVCMYYGSYEFMGVKEHFLSGENITEIPIGMVSQIAYLAYKFGKDEVLERYYDKTL